MLELLSKLLSALCEANGGSKKGKCEFVPDITWIFLVTEVHLSTSQQGTVLIKIDKE